MGAALELGGPCAEAANENARRRVYLAPSSFTPRDYQVRGFHRTRHVIASGKRRVLFVLPTGGGKTLCAAMFIRAALEKESSVLFVAHRTELLRQAFSKLVRSGVHPRDIGIIAPAVKSAPRVELELDLAVTDDVLWELHAARRPTAAVQIGSIDTMRARRFWPPAKLVIVDEAHRAMAASYKLLAAQYAEAVILGLTATPCRLDGRSLGDAFDELVEVASIRELIDIGALVEPRMKGVPVRSLPDLSKVKITAGDYDAKALGAACNQGNLVGDIVSHYERLGAGRRAVVFAASIEHSKAIVARFLEAGFAAEHLDGDTGKTERRDILARLASGTTRVVVNVGILTEGWDCPAVKVCILARPTKSLALFLQMAGRILRPWEGVEALILDHAGAWVEHGRPQDPQDPPWSLVPEKKKRRWSKGEKDLAKMCPKCDTVADLGATECAACGHVFPERKPRDVVEIDGELVEITAGMRRALLQEYAELVVEWRATNATRAIDGKLPMKPGVLRYWWGKRHPEWPRLPKGCKMPKLLPEEAARLAAAEESKARKSSARLQRDIAQTAEFKQKRADLKAMFAEARRTGEPVIVTEVYEPTQAQAPRPRAYREITL